ncbi:MAG: D-aminoacyl-tRNA deacylase [Candidatus Micrarchaeaceae archaeon]
MIGIIFNKNDEASMNLAEYVSTHADFEETNKGSFSKELNAMLVESSVPLINAELVDSMGFDIAYMLSKHVSAAGVSAFTVHATGNWNDKAELGGKPHELSVASPVEMLGVLQHAKAMLDKEIKIELTYEATHHGPLLKTPCLFVEIGGNDKTVASKELAGVLGAALLDSLGSAAEYNKVVIGIGSNHYPAKFSQLAFSKGYAFAHIMPKYAFGNEDGTNNSFMLDQAFERSRQKPELAVIDWHSFNAVERQEMIKKMNELGIDYERA